MSKGTYSNRLRMHEQQGTNHDEVANLKGIIEELKRTLSKSMYALQDNERLEKENKKLRGTISLLNTDYLALESEYFAKLDELECENAELKKDKERLDWLLEYKGNYWLLNNRQDIDKAMEESQ